MKSLLLIIRDYSESSKVPSSLRIQRCKKSTSLSLSLSLSSDLHSLTVASLQFAAVGGYFALSLTSFRDNGNPGEFPRFSGEKLSQRLT